MSSSATTPIEKAPMEIRKGTNGLDKVILHNVRGCSAEIYLYGAHVTSWKNEHGEELLFVSNKLDEFMCSNRVRMSGNNLSVSVEHIAHLVMDLKNQALVIINNLKTYHALPEAIFRPPKAIRGGIPICFPQFSNFGSLEAHGFARNRVWSIDPSPPPFPTSSTNKAYVDLILKPTEEDLKLWPHRFEFRLRVTLGPAGDLMLTSRIRNTNTDGKPFAFTFAYHTYFAVSDISEVRVEGLETLDYLDNLQKRERFTEQGDAITFESELDRIYLSTPTKIAILDHEKKRTFVLRKDGLPDAVVWNPWDKKAKSMADFGDDEYKSMVCVEAAAIEKAITLKPGEEWKGRLELSAVPSSYRSGQLDPQRVLGSSQSI